MCKQCEMAEAAKEAVNILVKHFFDEGLPTNEIYEMMTKHIPQAIATKLGRVDLFGTVIKRAGELDVTGLTEEQIRAVLADLRRGVPVADAQHAINKLRIFNELIAKEEARGKKH